MAMKKKKAEGEHSASTPVKHVVEVVEEETSISSIAEAPPQEVVETSQEEHVAPPLVQEQPQEEAVVAELFKRPQPMQVMPEISMHTESRSKKKFFVWVLIVLILVALLGGGVVLAKKGSFPTLSIIAPTPTPMPTPTPTPTPQPVNRKDITVQILNGGGVSGAASKMKAFLEDKGYKVADVSNADSYTYDKTEVHVKAAKSVYQKLLIDDLKDTYSISTDTATLKDSVSYDARVIVGTQ